MAYLENDNPHIERLRMLKDVWRDFYDYGEVDDDNGVAWPKNPKYKYNFANNLRRHIDFQVIHQVIALLTPRRQKIIKMRFGLNKERKGHTLEEVGAFFRVTRERVRQQEASILREMKEYFEHLGYCGDDFT